MLRKVNYDLDINIFSREEENMDKKNNFDFIKSWRRKEVLKDF